MRLITKTHLSGETLEKLGPPGTAVMISHHPSTSNCLHLMEFGSSAQLLSELHFKSLLQTIFLVVSTTNDEKTEIFRKLMASVPNMTPNLQ
jgi:hypothetical protein